MILHSWCFTCSFTRLVSCPFCSFHLATPLIEEEWHFRVFPFYHPSCFSSPKDSNQANAVTSRLSSLLGISNLYILPPSFSRLLFFLPLHASVRFEVQRSWKIQCLLLPAVFSLLRELNVRQRSGLHTCWNVEAERRCFHWVAG